MIGRAEVMPRLLRAVPSFCEKWREIERDPLHFEAGAGTRFEYSDAAVFTPHLVELQRAGATDELTRAFAVIELLHTDGDEFVRDLATIGYLEGVQTACSHAADVSKDEFEPYLGPESLRWWRGLNAFWSGQAPFVQAHDED